MNLVSRITAHLRRSGTAASAEDVALRLRLATAVQRETVHVPHTIRRYCGVRVIGLADGVLTVAPLAPLTPGQRQLLASSVSAREVRETLAPRETILEALTAMDTAAEQAIAALVAAPEDASAISGALHALLTEAIAQRASDIHITRAADAVACWVAYRIDGVLHVEHLLSPAAAATLAARVKNDAGMDFADTRRPQDGRLSYQAGVKTVEFRVATLPIEQGEQLTLRVLDSGALRPLADLFSHEPVVLAALQRIASLPPKTAGLSLITGATGSGKSTTMYGLLSTIDRERRSIATAEDPIEQYIPGLRQTSINPAAGLTYPALLKAHLRADVDYIAVGEVRDAETAEAALRAAESGHYLLSTMHTADAAETLHRLVGMLPADYAPTGLFALARHLQLVLNQRLVPTLCDCHTSTLAGEDQDLVPAGTTVGVSVGCPRCRNTGYRGRVVAVDALIFSGRPDVRHAMTAALTARDPEALVGLATAVRRRDSLARLVAAGRIDLATAQDILGAH